jgi:phospholipid/cholesterol/gamma-HCH transport system ATP-binding protein
LGEEIHISVRHLRFARGTRPVFRDLSCEFPRGKISVVLGPSGSGKSTLLRMISCLLQPQEGEIWVDGEIELTCMPERQARQFRRRIGMMFQGGALLDSMTVYDNVALPLREHTSKGEEEVRAEVLQVFDAVGLHDVNDLLPGELSGGMIRRAALARALILAPQVLLCDEPFAGLDPATVRLVESLLVRMNRRLGVTMIIASHHIGSTFRIADHTVLLLDGTCISAPPSELRTSRDPRVVAFLAEASPNGHPGEEPREAEAGKSSEGSLR